MEENQSRGTDLFPCAAYRGDIHKFPLGYLPIHWHKELEIFMLDEGKVKISTGKETFVLSQGEGYFSNAETLHGIYPLVETPCRFHSIVFDSNLISGAEGSIFDIKYTRPFLKESASIYPLLYGNKEMQYIVKKFEKIFSLCVEETEFYELFIRNLLSQIIVALMKTTVSTYDIKWSVQVNRIKGMVAWIEQNYRKNITVEQIAASQGISVRECQRSFQQIMNISPLQYTINHRITVAANLLQNTDLSITQIASSCGFDSSSYFSKQFKTILGMTPKQYRRKEIDDEI